MTFRRGRTRSTQPRVYFGELSPQYSIVGAPEGTPAIELDYPDGRKPTGQATNTYDGAGGVPMGSLFGKLLFATKFQDSNILLVGFGKRGFTNHVGSHAAHSR